MANSAFGGKLNLCSTCSHLFTLFVVYLVVDNNQPRPEAVVLGRPPRGGRLREVAPVGGVELERSKLSPRHRQRLLR